MELARGHMFTAASLLLCLVSGHYGAVAYETKRVVPTGPNGAETSETSYSSPPKPKLDLKLKRLSLPILNSFELPETKVDSLTISGKFEVKRLVVPSGPNPQESPDTPDLEIKRLVPSGPNAQESPDAPDLEVKRLLPSPPPPPRPNESPDPPRLEVKRLVPSGPNAQESPSSPSLDIKRLVPSGPNAQESPDSPGLDIKRLVPSGPNAQESPDSPTKPEDVESFVYIQSNSFEQSPPAL